MGFSNVALKDKLVELYPEISKHGVSVGLNFNEDKGFYVINFKKDSHELSTYLEKEAAEECMDGHKCVRLDVKLVELINNFNS